MTYSPTFFLIDSLVLTIDNEGSSDTEYKVFTLPLDNMIDPKDQVDNLIRSIEYVSSLLDEESRAKFLSGKFDKNGNAPPKLTLM